MELPSTEPLLERLRRVLAPHYAIERELGAGGMGVVYLGTDVALARPVAIKVLRPGPASLQIDLRFTREARLLARLQHPNIVAIHHAGEADGIRYFVMDYVEGRTLADRLAEGPLAPDAVIALGRDLLAAPAAATPLLGYDPHGLGGDPFARALLHLELGAWLAARGDTAAARRVWLWTDAWDVEDWPQREAQAGEVDIVVGAVARLRRARLTLEHDVQAACPPLRRVRDLWSDAEPGLASRQIADSLIRACP